MALENAIYKLELRVDGVLVGNVRSLAENFKWARRRTRSGVDEIDFTLNDVLFAEWCETHGTTISEMLRPLALDCRVIRDGVEIVGGFLATMPGYSPNGTSANLEMKFDGYLNYLDGIYIEPQATIKNYLSTIIYNFIEDGRARASSAGKDFNFVLDSDETDTLGSVEATFSSYKSVKEFITDRCDNTEGAGQFDVYFNADRTYYLKTDSNFGTTRAYTIRYPMSLNGVSATSISADEVGGFASKVIAVGAGETSGYSSESTAIISTAHDNDVVQTYGYWETLVQESSISIQTTLDEKASTELAKDSAILWTPKVTLMGRQVEPTPSGDYSIWIGDTVTVNNSADMTGSMNGDFRVMELEVDVSATGTETITPTLERIS